MVSVSQRDTVKYQIINKFIDGKIARKDAALILGVTERSITRWAIRVRDKGLLGVKHGNLRSKPANRIPDEIKLKTLDLIKKKYHDFNVSHIQEVLFKKHAINISYTTLWSWCNEKRLVKHPRILRRNVKQVRTRMPQEGLILQMDGCHHRFNGRNTWCLIAAIDDATSEIPYAEFFKAETTLNCMRVLQKIIEIKGVPKAIYTDQAGWSGGLKRVHFNQFQRACEELGINVIFARSPEAKGRIERAWRTIQDRLVPELRVNKIKKIEDANLYLRNEFIKNYWNKKLVVEPASNESGYTQLDPLVNLDDIFSLEYWRKIGKDQTISWRGQKFQVIPLHTYDLRRYMAVVRTYQNHSTKVFVNGHEVGVRCAPIGVQEGPYELRNRSGNVSLAPEFPSRSKEAIDREREEHILKIYGSKETYLTHGNFNLTPPPSYWEIIKDFRAK